jgi:hypothetical protein
MKKTLRKIIWAFLAVVVIQSACNFSITSPTQTLPVTPPSLITPTQSAPPDGIYAPPFATYNEVAARLPQTFNGGGYSLPMDLNLVGNMPAVAETLTDAQKAMLAQNGFVVAAPVAGQYREFYQIYENARYAESPVFITTDSVYHIYHLIFNKMLRDLETEHFILDLKSLTSAMLTASQQQLQTLVGTALEEPALPSAWIARSGAG